MSERKARVERFSVRFGVAASPEETVVLVPYGEDLARGFVHAKPLATGANVVRIVGMGATMPTSWPDWVRDARGLVLSELWAYRDRSTIRATAGLRRAIEDWLASSFAGCIGDLDPAEVLLSSSCLRMLQAAMIAQPDVLGVAALHGEDRVHLIHDHWIGYHAFRHAVEERGGELVNLGKAEARRVPWPIALGAYGTAALAANALEQVRLYALAGPTRKALAEARRARAAGDTPDTWVVLVGDWLRFSRIVIQSVAEPELDRGRRLGILVGATLVPGSRSEANMRRREGKDLWPGLGSLKQRLQDCVVDQVVGAETPRELASVVTRGIEKSSRALYRIARAGSRVGSGDCQIDLAAQVRQVALLATLDVSRALQADMATRNLLARHDFQGKTVVFATSQAAEMVATESHLRQAGATTVELAHGSVGTGEPGARQTGTHTVCVWTHADARVLAEPSASRRRSEPRITVAGMPRAGIAPRPDPPRRPERLLLVTNYVHHGYRINDRQPQEPYQNELLRAARLVAPLLGPSGTIRWRPHPADDAECVARSLAAFGDAVTRSTERDLATDIAWADVLVCSPSSTIFQAMFAGVPVFLHETPDYADTPGSDFVAPERRFFRAEELGPKLASCLEALRGGRPDVLDPERRAREALFGEDGQPIDFAEAFLLPLSSG